MSTLDIQSATATIGADPVDVESVDLTLDRTWSPYVQGSAVVAGLLVDLDPDAEPAPRFRVRLSQRFAIGLTGSEIAAQLAPPVEPELINGGFESGNLSGWAVVGAWDVNGSAPHSGAFKALISSPATLATLISTVRVPVVAGEKYAITAWVHTNLVGGTPAGSVGVIQDNGATAVANIPVSTGGAWVRVRHTYTVPPGVVDIRVRLAVSGGGAVGHARFDDVTILRSVTGSEIASGPWAGLTGSEIAELYETQLNPETTPPRSLWADLAIRDVQMDLAEKRTTLTLASDDAYLWDAGLVATTAEPFSTASVRAIVVSILARIGAALAPGAADGVLESAPLLEPGQKYRDFLEPLIQQAGLRLYADERRVFRLVDADDTLDGGVTLSTLRDVSGARPKIDRESGGYDSVVIEYRWTVLGVQQSAIDVAGPSRPRKTLKLTYDRTPYPGPGGAAGVLKRMQRRRREIPVDAVANYDTRPTMTVTLSSLALSQQSGRVARVIFQYPARMMRADLYDLEEISLTSVRAIPSGIQTDQLPGQTDTLNPGEL